MRFPSDVGISPMKLQLKGFKCFKDFRLPIESINSPEKNISKKSKNFRKLLPYLTNHSYTPIQKLDQGPRIDLNFTILLAFQVICECSALKRQPSQRRANST